ncbi:Tubulin Beta-4B Chain [Manis pentadactyla]|nr:Tubulin Beta-4B Chain [Manis pentadactyla]
MQVGCVELRRESRLEAPIQGSPGYSGGRTITRLLLFLTSWGCRQGQALTVPERTQQMFNAKKLMAAFHPAIPCSGTTYRMSMKVVDKQMLNIQNKKSCYFVRWLPSHVEIAVCDIPPWGLRKACHLHQQQRHHQQLFKHTSKQVAATFGEGMDEMDFTKA